MIHNITRYYLIYNTDNENIDYKTICGYLHKIQYEVREAKNTVIRMMYNKEDNRYNQVTSLCSLSNTNNINQSLRSAELRYKTDIKDMLKGKKSIAEYKSNQPIDLKANSITLTKENDNYTFTLSLFSRKFTAEYNIKTLRYDFIPIIKSNSQKTTLNKCLSGEYKICASQLAYDERKKQWYINLCCGFTQSLEQSQILSKDKIMGIDMGIVHPLTIAYNTGLSREYVDGGEIIAHNTKIKKQILSRQRQLKYCSDNRRGHGVNTLLRPVYESRDAQARFRDTVNHRYSRFVIDKAIKNKCGVIHMEDLTGISHENSFLKNWTYYDLQTKIKYKAEQAGIEVKMIDPHFTSQTCSQCGHVEEDNRPNQATFICQKCGYKENADYNAAVNIAKSTKYVNKSRNTKNKDDSINIEAS